MSMAIELAKKGTGFTNPNPIVGAVIIKDNEVIASGYHEYYGGLHAERNAIENAKTSLIGAAIYVTLEPCAHHGKTPPCCDAIIESGISKVVIGSYDPNILVAKKGINKLKANQIEVVEGVLKEECNKLNEVFFHYITTKLPYVVMKYAMTRDGKIATKIGESRWISNELSRDKVHLDRHKYSAIMVGLNTVLKDDPMLNCNVEGLSNPIRIICDTNLKIPLTSKIVQTAKNIKTIVATVSSDEKLIEQLKEYNVQILQVKSKNNLLDLEDLMIKLGQLEIDSILLEGGAMLNYSMLEAGLVNKVQTYISAKIFGGVDAKSAITGEGVAKVSDAIKLSKPEVSLFDDDILLESEVLKCSQD